MLLTASRISSSPVLIGDREAPDGDHWQVLINREKTVPLFFSRFERVCEIVDQDPEVKAAGRERYRFDQELGYAIRLHDLAGKG